MKIVPFRASHLQAIKLQPAQGHFIGALMDADYGLMLEGTTAFTALDDEGRVIACCGCEERWENCATAWALLSSDAGKHMVWLVRAVRGFIWHAAPWRRVEAAVDVGFDAGNRLVQMLGFQQEGVARAYRPDGGDCTIWARIKL